MDWSDFELLRKLCNESLSVNWTSSPSKAMHLLPDNRLALSPSFIQHVHNLGNWSVGSVLVDVFPIMQGARTHTDRAHRLSSATQGA